MPTSRLRILLVDDHAIVREGYRRLLERHADLVLAGEAQDGAQAYTLFCALAPDVVVMDIGLPHVSGIESLRRMRARDDQARVLIYSMHDEAVYVNRALQAGALGYVTKSSAPEVLVEAVRSVARRKSYLSRDVAQALALQPPSYDVLAFKSLSTREFEVFQCLINGDSLQQIAEKQGLTAKTVANLQSSIKHKLGAETSTQLMLFALRMGLLQSAGQAPETGTTGSLPSETH
jgi:DNA-binding NarL/FixJ family response regulator